jgi:hypothetical protein
MSAVLTANPGSTMKTAALRWARTATALVALSYGLVWATTPAQAAASVSVPIATPGLVSTLLPLYSCNTEYGLSTMKPAKLPKTVRVLVPHNNFVKLSVFTDGLGIVRLVAPSQWDCTASVSADGVSSLTIVPPNAAARSGKLLARSKAEEISGYQNGGCSGCAVVQACPLFSNARSLASGLPCPTKARQEKMVWISGGAAEFVDPPGVHGDGNPSGGAYPSYGVLTFRGGQFNSSWLATCVMPPKDQIVCATVLINFTNMVNGN